MSQDNLSSHLKADMNTSSYSPKRFASCLRYITMHSKKIISLHLQPYLKTTSSRIVIPEDKTKMVPSADVLLIRRQLKQCLCTKGGIPMTSDLALDHTTGTTKWEKLMKSRGLSVNFSAPLDRQWHGISEPWPAGDIRSVCNLSIFACTQTGLRTDRAYLVSSGAQLTTHFSGPWLH